MLTGLHERYLAADGSNPHISNGRFNYIKLVSGSAECWSTKRNDGSCFADVHQAADLSWNRSRFGSSFERFVLSQAAWR
jgi:hypothetical protein